MSCHELPAAPSPPPAVILLLSGTASPLWDPRVHGLAGEVERRLDPGLVSVAFADGRGPTLADALAAVRYLGCAGIVLVPAPEVGAAAVRRSLAAAAPAAETCEVLRCRWEASEIAEQVRRWTAGEPACAA